MANIAEDTEGRFAGAFLNQECYLEQGKGARGGRWLFVEVGGTGDNTDELIRFLAVLALSSR